MAKICSKKMPKIVTSHEVLEPLEQVLLASRDVMISGLIFGSKLQRVFTLGDGCWLPKKKGTLEAIFRPFLNLSKGQRARLERSLTRRDSLWPLRQEAQFGSLG